MTEGEMPEEEARSRMARALAIMKESAHTPIQTPVRSMGGLIGGEAEKPVSYTHLSATARIHSLVAFADSSAEASRR